MHGVDQSGEGLPLSESALQISARLHRGCGGMRHIWSVVMAGVDVCHGGAVTDDISVKMPGVAEMIAQQHGVGAGGSSIDGVIGAHDGLGVGFGHCSAEGGKVGVLEIVRRDIDVEAVPDRLRATVHSVVLGRGDNLEVFRVITLHAGNKGDTHAGRKEWIFSVGLLAAAPAGIAERC